ncbi:MAG: immune inhibitor A, partial [Bacteroidetes bacterium]|nr:immune inhibitor A [Bacteroidota bacterium]
MKQTRFALAALLLAILHLPVYAQDVYTKVKVYYDSADLYMRSRIIGLLQIDHFIPAHGSIVSEVNANLLPLLQQNNIRYEVLVPDVARSLRKLNDIYFAARQTSDAAAARVALEQRGTTVANIIPQPTAFQVKSTFGGYYTYTEMMTAINTLVSTYPSIAKKITLGTTAGGKAIVAVKISDNVNLNESNEPEVLYLGLQHAREAITGASMIFFMQYLCQFYYTDTRIQNLVDNRQIYIVPCFNPDGWDYNYTSMSGSAGGGWRKNRSAQSGGQFGVDLNRNWGIDWGNCGSPILGAASSCGSNSSSQETYYGTGAFSENETKAIRAFVKDSGHHFVVGFDQHSYGPYYSLPYGRKSLHPAGLPALQGDFFTAVPALMGTYNGMRAADSYDALGYEVAGGFKDYMLMGDIGAGTKDTVYALTGEGAAGGGTGGTYGDFWAPASQIVYLSQGMCYQNLQLAYAAGSYVDIQDTSDMALNALSGNMGFTIRRLGRGNDPVTITMIPLENIKTVGAPVVVNSLPNYYDTYAGSISYTLFPGLTNGQRVRFIWKVATAGYSYTDTVTKFYNPTVTFTDDMEGNAAAFAAKWTSTSNVTDKWAYTTLAAYGGTHSLTESPAGNYTTSTTRTIQYKNNINLSGVTAAYLSFWVKHRAENFRDKMQVQVSTNSGSTWTAVVGSTTVQEPGTLDDATINGQPALTGIRDYWTREYYDLTSFKNNTIQLRMQFTSDSDPSGFKFEVDDGFY